MALQSGQQLSHYHLDEVIGEGGMGVVWKATDTTLDRQVALKVLPDHLAGDKERLARFEREARVLASLNHPGIATLHGLHEADGVRFLTMELVEGMDLSKRLVDGPVPVEEAMLIAQQVAEALEAAHENGIVHRDLKPANVLITPDGKAKVLDFGLAKAFEPETISGAGSLSPTLTTPATRVGVILGTAAYMSPEQAKGKPVDKRADIWAFGCFLYEMVTGKRPYSGEGISEILAAVIMAPVDLAPLPESLPSSIKRLLKRCLEKDPRRRLRDIGEARFVIEETLSGVVDELGVPAIGTPTEPERRRGSVMAAGGLFAVLGAAAAAALFWLLAPTSPESPVRRFEIPASGPHISGVQARMVSISPDGAKLAFVTDGSLRIRWFDKLETRDVVTQVDPVVVFWSPDSAWLGWAGGGKLWKASAEGGESMVIADQPGILSGGTGASWGPDGRIALTRGDGPLFEVSERGGDLQVILENDAAAESDFHEPYYLPDGNLILTVHKAGGRPDTLSVLVDGERKDLLTIEGQDIWRAVYSRTGHILYRRHPTNPGIWALPFSLSGHEVTGEPFLVVPDGDVASISDDGTLIHVTGAVTRVTQMVWVDREGNVLEPIGQPQEQWPFPALSPDGRSIAIAATENEAREVWIHDIERGTKTRLTFGATAPGTASWRGDGQAIVFDEGNNPPFAMSLQAADGSGEKQEIGEGWGGAFSPDGEYFVFSTLNAETEFDIYYRDAGFERDPVPVVQDEGMQLWGRVSPDGKYIVYTSNETGQPEIYVKRFPGGEGKWQVSLGGGSWPRWSDTGERIYYVVGETIMEVDASTGESLRLGNAREVFTREPLGWPLPLGFPPGFDVSSDDQRFIICRSVSENKVSQSILLVENWFEEFRPVE